MNWETTLIGSGNWLCIRCQVRACVLLRHLHVDHACVFNDTIFIFFLTFLKMKDMRVRAENIENVHSFMAHLNVLAYTCSTFKFANSRGYGRARHAGKKMAQ